MAETRRKPIGSRPGGFWAHFLPNRCPKAAAGSRRFGEVNYLTPDKDEKAAYLAAVSKRMGELLGPLHHESYAHVDAVKADSYGFGGLTQGRRYIAGQLVAVR